MNQNTRRALGRHRRSKVFGSVLLRGEGPSSSNMVEGRPKHDQFQHPVIGEATKPTPKAEVKAA